MISPPLRPAWVEINSRAIENNARRLTQIIGGAELMAMVKANGYGHGAIETARAAIRGGATWLGVYEVGEGIELRAAGIDARILIVGPTPAEWVPPALEHQLTLALPSPEYAASVSTAARALGQRARVHIKIDTGMTRLGVSPDQAVAWIQELSRDQNLEIEGAFTHFAVADEPDARGIPNWGSSYTRRQYEIFRHVTEELEHMGVPLRYRHAANSPASLNFADARFNLVRSGILIYGLHPSSAIPRPSDFTPALAFKTRLALVREVPRGTFVSYGSTFETTRPSRIGVLMVGYADGFRRGPRNYGEVLVHGARAPIVGRVCMDQTMIDVTEIAAAQSGDEVVLIGKQGAEEITAEQVGENLGTNNYEVVTTISARVPRLYF